MVAVVVDDRFDLSEFQHRLSRRLPDYACPVMVRISPALDTTETPRQGPAFF
jgi:fatty-acyl-CoA synthase